MNEINPPVQSLRSLVLATVIALLLAVIILITAVLPAEYGIDPTGFGKKLGLTQLAAQGEDIVDPLVSSCKDQLAKWTDSTTLVVPVHSGLEYKFHVQKGEKLDYSWHTDGAKVYFDLHGEPKGDKTGFFKSFKVGSESQASGNFTAEFEGPHGWYFENKTQAPITVILNTKGGYRVIGLM
ncbi:hypothetical protein [Crenothrix sp.]|uniref:hypothetical protein n=1 Tax=Crenothrix sp. TaxID=3100433 RepID=UPI00374D1C30